MTSLKHSFTAATKRVAAFALSQQPWMAWVGAIGLGCLCPATVRAQSLLVDQSNAGFSPTLFQNIQAFSPIGQEFTPTFSSLNAVELYTEAFPGTPINLFVNIHQGTIGGPILGTSATTTLPSTNIPFGEPVVTRFDFASTVPLVPDNLFVIEVVAPGQTILVGSSGGPFSTYPGGNQILGGVPQSNNDLWFREGLTSTSIPEPSSMLGVLAFGPLGAASALKRRQKSISRIAS